jgi:hypothetical protein
MFWNVLNYFERPQIIGYISNNTFISICILNFFNKQLVYDNTIYHHLLILIKFFFSSYHTQF